MPFTKTFVCNSHKRTKTNECGWWEKARRRGLRQVTCRGSVRRDISVSHRGPQEAWGKLLPFSCMQEKQLIKRVSSEKDGSRGRHSLMCSRSNSYDHHEGALLCLSLYWSIAGCAAWRTYIRASLHFWNVCLFLFIRGHVPGRNSRSKSVIWHLCVADGPLEMAGALGHFLECFEPLQMQCKTCHWSRKQRLLHNNTLAYCPVGSPSETRPVTQWKGSRFGLRNVKVSPDDSADVKRGTSGYFILVSLQIAAPAYWGHLTEQQVRWRLDINACYWWHVSYLWDSTFHSGTQTVKTDIRVF